MCPLNESGQFDDVDNSAHQHIVVTAGLTRVEAKVGAERLDGRQTLYLQNVSNQTVYWGGPAVTTTGSTRGVPLFRNQFISLPFGSNIPVYLIADIAGCDVVVGEAG